MWLVLSVPWVAYHGARLYESQQCYRDGRKRLAAAPKEAWAAQMWDSLVRADVPPDRATEQVSEKYGMRVRRRYRPENPYVPTDSNYPFVDLAEANDPFADLADVRRVRPVTISIDGIQHDMWMCARDARFTSAIGAGVPAFFALLFLVGGWVISGFRAVRPGKW